jgi:hypothetical protein
VPTRCQELVAMIVPWRPTGGLVRRLPIALAVALSLTGCANRESPAKLSATADGERALARPARAAIPLPRQTLLTPQPPPQCDYKSGHENGKAQPQPADANEQERSKLDWERQCFRSSERLVRERLAQLQASVRETIKAVRRVE